jgi:hypothetical protein
MLGLRFKGKDERAETRAKQGSLENRAVVHPSEEEG